MPDMRLAPDSFVRVTRRAEVQHIEHEEVR
jgi:hypothetical protein